MPENKPQSSAPTPLPIPTDLTPPPKFILVFGGTFDPPHRGHTELPLKVRDELEAREGTPGQGWLMYVPAARSPHKFAGPAVDDVHRLKMLELAIAKLPRVGIWTDEIDRALSTPPEPQAATGKKPTTRGPSYTIDTLTRARAWLDAHGMESTMLRLLIGADQSAEFHRWRQPRDILTLARPAVMVRGELHDENTLFARLEATKYWNDGELRRWKTSIVSVGRLEVSATRLREALRLNNRSELDRWFHPEVKNYIKEKLLYQTDSSKQ